jgi:hypothetical protein
MIFTESYLSPTGKEYKATGKDYAAARATIAEQIAADLANDPGETWHVSYFDHEVLAALRLLCRHPLPNAEPPPPHLHRHLAHLLLAREPTEGIDAVNAFVRDHPGEWEIVGMRASLSLSPDRSASYDRRALTLYATPNGVNVSITRGAVAADDGEHTRAEGLLSKIANVAADALARPVFADLSVYHLPPCLRAPVRVVLISRSEGLRNLAESIEEAP